VSLCVLPQAARAVRWDDPELTMDWPLEIGIGALELALSARDNTAPTFQEAEKYNLPLGLSICENFLWSQEKDIYNYYTTIGSVPAGGC